MDVEARSRGERDRHRARPVSARSLPSWRVVALASLVLLGCGPTEVPGQRGLDAIDAPTSAPNGAPIEVLWQAGMEGGDLSEWSAPGGRRAGGGPFNSDGGFAEATDEVARTGRYSAKLLLPNGVGGTRLFRWEESDRQSEAFYSAWFYIPSRFEPDEWWDVFQFKSRVSEEMNDPFWVINIGARSDGRLYLYLGDWQRGETFRQTAADVPIGSWFQVECFLRQSSMGAGRIACWQDRTLLWDMRDVDTHYPGATNQWSVNNYSSRVGPAPVDIYVDDAAIYVLSDSSRPFMP